MNIFSRAYRDQNPLEWKKLLRQMGIPILLTLFICIIPMYLLYAQNIEEMYFVLILIPIAISIACGLGLLVLLTLILRKPCSAGLWSTAVMALCLNFRSVTSVSGTILPFMDAALSGIILIVIVLTGIYFLIAQFERKKIQNQIALIVLAALGALLIYNTIIILPTVAGHNKKTAVSREDSSEPGITMAEIMQDKNRVLVNSNIYMLIMDEYADFVMFEKYYNEDQEAFKQFLMDAGFNISYSSHSNSISTPKCIADLVNLDYVTTNTMTDAEARKLYRKDAALHTVFQALGYSLYQVSTNNVEFSPINSLLDPAVLIKAQFTTENGETVDDIAAGNSILSLFSTNSRDINKDITGEEQGPLLTTEEVHASEKYQEMSAYWKQWVDNVLGVFDFFQNSANLNFIDKTVVYSYICCPHVPFFFNSDGSIYYDQRFNWLNKAYYSGQHQFVSQRLQLVVTSILQHNSNSIIILQSDHGIRNHIENFEIERKDAYQTFNAVYFGGQKLDIEGLSGINTLRLILTKLGAAGFPQVADPQAEKTTGR